MAICFCVRPHLARAVQQINSAVGILNSSGHSCYMMQLTFRIGMSQVTGRKHAAVYFVFRVSNYSAF
jgi:hypothetical protein